MASAEVKLWCCPKDEPSNYFGIRVKLSQDVDDMKHSIESEQPSLCHRRGGTARMILWKPTATLLVRECKSPEFALDIQSSQELENLEKLSAHFGESFNEDAIHLILDWDSPPPAPELERIQQVDSLRKALAVSFPRLTADKIGARALTDNMITAIRMSGDNDQDVIDPDGAGLDGRVKKFLKMLNNRIRIRDQTETVPGNVQDNNYTRYLEALKDNLGDAFPEHFKETPQQDGQAAVAVVQDTTELPGAPEETARVGAHGTEDDMELAEESPHGIARGTMAAAQDATDLADTFEEAETMVVENDKAERCWVADKRQLLAFVMATERHGDRGANFTQRWSACAKEVGLAGVVVDPAIERLAGYNRGAEGCDVIGHDSDGFFRWNARPDFSVIDKLDDIRYSCLYGETDSKGQSEEDAMRKMAMMSLHSYKVIHQITGEHRDILCAYVSEQLCTMYVFYGATNANSNSGEPSFVMRQILRFADPFRRGTLAVGFLRRFFNFVADKQPLQTPTDKVGVYRDIVQDLPSATSTKHTTSKRARTTNQTDPPNPPGCKRRTQNAPDVQDTRVLQGVFCAAKGTNRANIFHLQKTTTTWSLCAKWTRNEQEVQILRRLQRRRRGGHDTHIIEIREIIYSADRGVFIVMPLCTPLSELVKLPSEGYMSLRAQLTVAVAFMHSKRIAHCDLKPENVVVRSQEQTIGNLRVIDFDSAMICAPGTKAVGFHGTHGWTAPEVREGGRWEPMRADVWAMGLVLRYLAMRARVPDDLVRVCLKDNPSLRPSAAAINRMVLKLEQGKKRARESSGEEAMSRKPKLINIQ